MISREVVAEIVSMPPDAVEGIVARELAAFVAQLETQGLPRQMIAAGLVQTLKTLTSPAAH